MSDKNNRSYIVDDEGHIKGLQVYREDGKVDVYDFKDKDEHSHNVYENMDEYMEKVDNAFAGEGDTKGSVYSREADEEPEEHPWNDRDGVMSR